MVRSIRAIYANGLFHPLDALDGLPDCATVTLTVEDAPAPTGMLADFAGRWTVEDADRIAALIEEEFERVDSREW